MPMVFTMWPAMPSMKVTALGPDVPEMRLRPTHPDGTLMIAVIFEVEPADGHIADYLDIAAQIRPMLDEIEGFISIERFQSLSDPRKILSLSFFEDEAAIERWRNLPAHRAAQTKGRGGVFGAYRLRIASVVRDYGMFERSQAPSDSREVHVEGTRET